MMKHRVSHSAIVLGAVLLGLLPFSTRGESLWLQDLIRLHADDVYGENVTEHRFQVHYLLPAEPDSFDDQDIWVVSQEGFSQLATFEGAEPVTDAFPEILDGEIALLEAGLDPALWHHPDYATWRATYSIKAEAEGGWTPEDNGRYAVLLEHSQVAFQGSDGFVPPQYLGSFRMAIGEPAPAYPDAARLSVTSLDDGSHVANLELDYEAGPVEVRSWGEVRRDGNRLIVDLDIVHAEGEANGPLTLEHQYRLPDLERGTYVFTAMMGARVLGREPFAVGGGDEPIPADVALEAYQEDSGNWVAHAIVHFHDPYYVMEDWGTPVREGNQITIKARATKVVFVREPDEPAIFEHRYDLGALGDGRYVLAFKLGDEVCPHIGFHVGHPDPDGLPVEVGMDIVQTGGAVAADVTVIFHPDEAGQHWRIRDWGEPRLEGNTFYLNAEAAGPEEPDAAGPVVQEHRYQLLPRGNGNGGGDPEPVDFRTLDLPPFYLLPSEPAELIFRNEDDWTQWVVANWPPNIDAPFPAPPVDFTTEMIVAVFSGEVGQGVDLRIQQVTKDDDGLKVHHVTTLPGVMPEDDGLVRTGHMIALPLSDLRVRFEGEVIALPSPPVEGAEDGPFAGHEEADANENDADGADGDLPHGDYRVVFAINGVVYAESRFVMEGDDPAGIPARAELEMLREDGSWYAEADVYFTGYPYHSIAEWSEPVLHDQTFFIDAQSVQVEFFTEPDLPYVESHRYFLLREGDHGGGDGIDYKIVESPVTIDEAQQRVVDTIEDWYDLIGFVPGPNVRPISPPVDLETHTLAVIALGQRPNACYGVRVEEVFQTDGVVTIVYEARYPRDGEACAEVITYPTAMVALPKNGLPIEFVEVVPGDPEPGADGGPEPEGESRGKTYDVVFRIDGVIYARTSFTIGSDTPDPDPEPDQAVRLAISSDGSRVEVHAALHFHPDGTPVIVRAWGDPTVDNHVIRANVSTATPGDEEPGEEPAEHVYVLDNLTSGSYVFVLEVDGEARARAAFVVRPEDQVDDFLEWLERMLELAGGAEASNDLGFFPPAMSPENLDGDRWRDVDEFLLGMNPVNAADAPMIRPEWLAGEIPGKQHLALRFHRRVNAEAQADFVVEASADLDEWVRDPSLLEVIEVRALEGAENMEEVTVCLKAAADESPFRFLRLVLMEKSGAAEE